MNDEIAYVVNPETNRHIVVGGPTWDGLITRKGYTAQELFQDGLFYHSAPGKTKRKSKKKGRKTNKKTYRPISSRELEQVLHMPVAHEPSLQEVLHRVHQPAKRRHVKTLMKHKGDPRGRATRGWSGRAPSRGESRHRVKRECGNLCFLAPDSEGFPICPRCNLGNNDQCTCAIDCGGVQAAYNRARQWGHDDIAEMAQRILNEKCQ